MYKNSEGYNSPTEGMAISNAMREYRREQKRRFADKNRRKVYVASPYAGDTEKNTEAAVRYCRLVVSRGYMPVASHLMYPQVLDDSDPAGGGHCPGAQVHAGAAAKRIQLHPCREDHEEDARKGAYNCG